MIKDVFPEEAVLEWSMKNEEFIRQTIQRIALKAVGQAGAVAWERDREWLVFWKSGLELQGKEQIKTLSKSVSREQMVKDCKWHAKLLDIILDGGRSVGT